MRFNKGFHLFPIATLTPLAVARSIPAIGRVERDIARRIICGAHCFHPQTVEAVEYVFVCDSLRLVRAVLVDGYVDIPLQWHVSNVFDSDVVPGLDPPW